MLEFTAGVLSGEPPVYDGASIVALAFEGGDLLPQQHFIAGPAVQTLPAEDANSISAMFSQLPCTGVW